MEQQNWNQLQSNPEVMNAFAQKLGLNVQQYTIQDVLSIQQWAQDMVPKPVLGVILLFQITQAQSQFSNIQEQTLNSQSNSQKLFYMKQYAENACGTIALFHVILNSFQDNPDVLISPSKFTSFLEKAQNKTPQQIGQLLKQNEQILQEHKQAASEGQSQNDVEGDSHFVAFVQKEGNLYELDGCKKMPVNHGPCTKQELLERSCEEIKKFMDRDPQNLKFSILVLAKKAEL